MSAGRVAVIPARGGSKRIPRKNIRAFAGKPMIAHSIECALRTDLFERVVVSTDDEEIARVAEAWGAQAPFTRPAQLSDDHCGLADVIAHAVSWLLAEGPAPSAVCCIYATAPFMRSEDIIEGLRVLESGDRQYVFPVTTFASSVFRSFCDNGSGGLAMLFPEHRWTRSQDLPEALHDAAQFYWGRVQAWMDRVPVFDQYSSVIVVPRWRVQDIDTEEDWARAEAMAGYLQEWQGPVHRR